MKSPYILLSFLFLSILHSRSQDPTLDWAAHFGGAQTQGVRNLAIDTSNNIYIVGNFNGTTTFGTSTMSSSGLSDIYVAKYDNGGSFQWVKQIGGTTDDSGTSIVVDSAGNLIITGTFTGTVDFDPGTNSTTMNASTGGNMFVLKLSGDGNFIWAKQMGGTSNAEILAVTIDGSDNVYTTGYFWNTADFDPGASQFLMSSAVSNDVFISKLDSDGNFAWARQFAGFNEGYGNGIAIDSSGNVLVSGFFSGDTDFDPGTGVYTMTSTGSTATFDAFIAKLNASTDLVWAKKMGGSDYDYARSLVLDSQGNIFTTVDFYDTMQVTTVNGTETFNSAGAYDILVIKLASNGDIMWTHQIGGNQDEVSASLSVDSNNNLFLVGRFWGTTNLDLSNTVNLTSQGSSDIFMSKFEASGNLEWAKRFGGSGADAPSAMTLDAAGDILSVGGFQGTVDFGVDTHVFELTSSGSTPDVYIQKLTSCTVDASVTTIDNTLTANSGIGNYQWVDCDSNSDIMGETNQSFTPTTSGNYAVRITYNNCVEVSACNTVNILGIDDVKALQKVSVYPNPVKNTLYIDLGGLHEVDVKIFDVLGQVVFESSLLNEGTHEIRGLSSAGVYFVKLTSNGSHRTFKVLKR